MSTEPSDPDDEGTELPEVGESSEADEASEVEGEDVAAKPRRVHFALDLSGIVSMPKFSFPDDTFAQVIRAAGIPNLTEKIIPALDLGPKIDSSMFDLSRLLPKIDLLGTLPSSVFPANAMSEQVTRLAESMSLPVPKIDFQDLLPSMAFPALNIGKHYSELFASISNMLEPMMQRLRECLPPNWPDGGDMFDRGLDIIRDEGIPLVWLPRAEIVIELLDAPDRDSRLDILVTRKMEVTADCREVLEDVTSSSFAGQVALLLRAVDALVAGHDEAAQALAVVVTETAVARSLGSKYGEVKKKVVVDLNDVPLFALRLRAALLPIGSFYTSWYASEGKPIPELLSRHVAVHQADPGHYTANNAVLAVMLATSVLRALQEFEESAGQLEE